MALWALEIFSLFDVPVEVLGICIPHFEEGIAFTEHCACLCLDVGEVLGTMIVRQAGQRIAARAKAFRQLGATVPGEGYQVIGDDPHRYTGTLSPAAHEFARLGIKLCTNQSPRNLRPLFDTGARTSAVLSPQFSYEAVVAVV